MLTFNGKHITELSGAYKSIRTTRLVLPDTDDRIMSMPGMDGVYDYGRNLKENEITVEILIQAGSPQELIACSRQIAAWLDTETVRPLIFDQEPDKQYMARRRGGIVLDKITAKAAICRVNFFIPRPYAEDIGSTVTGLTGENTGTEKTPCIITCTIKVAGTERHYFMGPTFGIKTGDDIVPADGLKVELLETGEFLRIAKKAGLPNLALTHGDVVEFNTASRLITVNGASAMAYRTLDSKFFHLPKKSEFTLDATIEGPPETKLTAETTFRQLWR